MLDGYHLVKANQVLPPRAVVETLLVARANCALVRASAEQLPRGVSTWLGEVTYVAAPESSELSLLFVEAASSA